MEEQTAEMERIDPFWSESIEWEADVPEFRRKSDDAGVELS